MALSEPKASGNHSGTFISVSPISNFIMSTAVIGLSSLGVWQDSIAFLGLRHHSGTLYAVI